VSADRTWNALNRYSYVNDRSLFASDSQRVPPFNIINILIYKIIALFESVIKNDINPLSCNYADEMQPEPKRSVVDMHPISEGQSRTQRPSLLMDLLTGDLGSRAHINRTPAETPVSHSTAAQSLHAIHQSNTSSAVKTTQSSQVTAPPNGTHIISDTSLLYFSVFCRSKHAIRQGRFSLFR